MPGKVLVRFEVNGASHEVACRQHDVLLDVLRETLGLTGTKRGCDMGTCGCCTVILEGRPVLSCLALAAECEGRSLRTIEGLRRGESLHPLQESFAGHGGSQCGFCTPGFIMTSVALLERNPAPSSDEIKEAIAGNQCRCTGYLKILEAIEAAASRLREAPGTVSCGEKP